MPSPTTVVSLTGNPRPRSRTRQVADHAARRVAELLAPALVEEVDLGELREEIFAEHRPRVDAARAAVAQAGVLVVATPTYKATYTGLLKSFLDQYGSDGLRGVVAVPLQVAGDPVHLLAAEVHLRPLLVELGAHVPTRALVLTEAQLPDLEDVVGRWLEHAGPLLAAALRAAQQPADDATVRSLA